MKANEICFNTIAGVPTHYARSTKESYGTRGRQYRFCCTEEFYKTLNQFFVELFLVCPFGAPEVIVSGGAYVKDAMLHGEGRAFDIDAVFWEVFDFITLEYNKNPQFYLAVEAILRRHFGTVLGYFYNKAHQDHFHIDTGSRVGFDKNSKSRVLFIQHVCYYIFRLRIARDGIWGNETKKAVVRMNNILDETYDIFDIGDWKKLLLNISYRGFDYI